MGITRECLEIYARQVEAGNLKFSDCNVIELGAQTVHFHDPDFVARFLARVGVAQSSSNFYAGMTGKEMHQKFGHTYACIDLYDGDALPWDLNTIACPPIVAAKYDLVTNFGTTEHVMDQMNAFRLVHDFTKEGGIMFHIVPITMLTHGLFNYTPTFFECLARGNDYEVLEFDTSEDLHWSGLQSLVPYGGTVPAGHVYLHAMMRKRSPASFVTPSQPFKDGTIV